MQLLTNMAQVAALYNFVKCAKHLTPEQEAEVAQAESRWMGLPEFMHSYGTPATASMASPSKAMLTWGLPGALAGGSLGARAAGVPGAIIGGLGGALGVGGIGALSRHLHNRDIRELLARSKNKDWPLTQYDLQADPVHANRMTRDTLMGEGSVKPDAFSALSSLT